MKDFFYFLEGRKVFSGSAKMKSKIRLTILMLPAMFLVAVSVTVLNMLLSRWGIIDHVGSSGMIPTYMNSMSTFRIFLEIVILAPVLEETAFRGPLQHEQGWFRAAVFSFVYLMICRMAGLNFYEISLPTAVVLVTASLSLLISRRAIADTISVLNRRPNRMILIWSSAVAFGFWHYYNFDFGHSGILTISVNLLPFVFNGLLLSYVAAKNGLIWSMILHAANNAWPLIVWC